MANEKINLNEMESGDLIEQAVKQQSASATDENIDENVSSSAETEERSEEPETQPPVKKDEKIEEEIKEPHIPYSRFKEVNDSLKEAKSKLASLEELEKMGYTIEDVMNTLRSSDPDETAKIDLAKFRREIAELKQHQSKLSEEAEFINLVKKHPEAAQFEDDIKEIGRANPKLSHEDIFIKYFQKIVNFEKQIKKNILKKNSQVETGKGSGEEISESMTPAKFSKLSLEEQRAYLKKLGL